MASSETISIQDLRSNREFSRAKDHRIKWALGGKYGPGRREEDNRPRPAQRRRVPKATHTHQPSIFRVIPTEKARRFALLNKMTTTSDESSADEDIEDIEEPSAAPAPDAEIAYSFDAERGPSHGSQILSLALEKAVERYEVRQTDKLIKEEYEVLDVVDDAFSPGPKSSNRKISPEDADYEFIEA